MNNSILKSVRNGLAAVFILLGIYVFIVSLVSGWDFMLLQLFKYWYYVGALALGFGIQVGLYTYLKNAIKQKASPHVLAVSGTTSTVAIISQYQVQLFWVGIAFNFAGILYVLSRIIKFSKGA
jgi:P-type Cu+ transporter